MSAGGTARARAGSGDGARPRTVVVGGGLAGAAVALALAERGAPVTVVDPGPVDGAATPASAGMLAPGYESAASDEVFAIGLRARAAWPAFAARVERLGGASPGLRFPGILTPNADEGEEADARDALRRHREHGAPAELLEPEAARELHPALPVGARSFLWLPEAGRVHARTLAATLGPALRAAGVGRVHAAAARVLSRAGRAGGVELRGGGRLDADRVVVAAGAWSGGLEGLPRPLPVRPVRGQILRWDAAPSGVRRIVADHAGRYAVPRDDGSLLVGATMEEAGFEVACTEEGRRGLRETAGRLVPDLAGREPDAAWAGLRPLAPDGLPVVGEDPDLAGLLYAGAYGRNGILLSPLLGEHVARLALGEEPEVDLAAFRPDRFDARGG